MINRSFIDASYFGNEIVSSVGAWQDVTIEDWDPSRVISPTDAVLASLSVTETSGNASCFLLLRAEDGEATNVAWEIKQGSTEAFGVYNPDRAIRTVSIYGSARLKATFLPG